MAPTVASKKEEGGDSDPKGVTIGSEQTPHPLVESTRVKDILYLLLCIRAVNALVVSTFFQPDEYYQALEPAWDLAFGQDSNAIITWEWNHELRSSIFPIILAGWYKIVAIFCDILFPPVIKTKLLLLAPQVFMVLPATIMDSFTWLLAEKLYGERTPDGIALLGLLVLSPWQWMVSIRTLSNTFETSLTIVALYFWPWSWMKSNASSEERKKDVTTMKYSLFLAALACMIRPTNALIWLILAAYTAPFANMNEFAVMLRDASTFGSAGVLISALADRLYYEKWTFPAANFFSFNIGQNIATFYGFNRIDYYFTEGIPTLFVAFTPFVVLGLLQSLSSNYPAIVRKDGSIAPQPPLKVMRALAIVSLFTPLALTFVPHKEARFIYPIFPILSILAARPAAVFFKPLPNPSTGLRKALLRGLIITHVIAAFYFGSIHNRGVISVMGFLRQEFENHNPDLVRQGETNNLKKVQFGTLMPCHSTPFRSHLVYPEIEGWALSCEPPINMTMEERAEYRDMADEFYDDPVMWMRRAFGARQLAWPDYLLFYEQLLPAMNEVIMTESYEQCWRGFNSAFHPDWRRSGDVIVWCKTPHAGGPERSWRKS